MMTNYPGILFHQVPVHRSQVRPDNIIIPAATSDYAVTVQFQRCLENQPENPWSVDPSTEGWIVPSKPESPVDSTASRVGTSRQQLRTPTLATNKPRPHAVRVVTRSSSRRQL